MIAAIALRNLCHDRVRLLVTLTGIVFAVVLVTLQCGLFWGFMTTISGVVDNSRADVWVVSRGVKTFDIAMPMPEARYHQVLSVPGVAEASRMVVDFAFWKKPDGGQESIEVVAFDAHKGMGGPWNLVRGNLESLGSEDGVILDQLYLEKLGVSSLGEEAEIVNRRARVVGFTLGIRSFTTSPYVFTAYRNGHQYSRFAPAQITYVLVRAAGGVSPKELSRRISARLPDVEAFTTEEFSHKTRMYWMMSTGAGAALLLAALLGFVVGMVVVAQTLYATTMDHLGEFATLKAMGAPNGYIIRILVVQACISAGLGYGIGLLICVLIVEAQRFGDASIVLSPALALAIFALTLCMCVTASLISIRKIMRLDPAIVFRGR